MLTHMYVNLTYQNDIVDKRKEALLLNSLSEMLRGMYHTGRQISYNRYFISQYRKRRKGNRDMTMKWDSFSNKDINVGRQTSLLPFLYLFLGQRSNITFDDVIEMVFYFLRWGDGLRLASNGNSFLICHKAKKSVLC